MRTDQELAAYIGLDWGDRQHAVQLQPAAGGPVEALALEQRPHVLHGWVAQLRERFGGRPVGIAIEQRRGAVIHALMQYEFLVESSPFLVETRHRPHPLGGRQRAPGPRRHCASDRTQRQSHLGASSPGMSEVPQADVSRIRGPVDPLLRVGAPLLRSAAEPGQRPSRGAAFARLQMDADSLSLLAGPDTVRRSHLPRRATPTRVATRQRSCLTAQLRCPCPQHQ